MCLCVWNALVVLFACWNLRNIHHSAILVSEWMSHQNTNRATHTKKKRQADKRTGYNQTRQYYIKHTGTNNSHAVRACARSLAVRQPQASPTSFCFLAFFGCLREPIRVCVLQANKKTHTRCFSSFIHFVDSFLLSASLCFLVFFLVFGSGIGVCFG